MQELSLSLSLSLSLIAPVAPACVAVRSNVVSGGWQHEGEPTSEREGARGGTRRKQREHGHFSKSPSGRDETQFPACASLGLLSVPRSHTQPRNRYIARAITGILGEAHERGHGKNRLGHIRADRVDQTRLPLSARFPAYSSSPALSASSAEQLASSTLLLLLLLRLLLVDRRPVAVWTDQSTGGTYVRLRNGFGSDGN